MQELLESVEDGAGLRLDGTVSHLPSGEQVWYDTTTVHTTCSTKLKAELALTRKRQAAGKEGKDMQSAGLMAVYQTKLDRYALLAALTERQVLDGLRTAAPTILPVAVSTHGEFCPGAVRMQEWLTGKYRERLLLEGDRDDGEKTEGLTTAFRQEFLSSLLVASCKGLADMLLAAGMPFAGKRAHGGSSAGGSSARAPPLPTTSPSRPRGHSPHLGSGSHTELVKWSEGEDNEDECSTASSSADGDEDAYTRGLPRRSARVEAQARTRAAARTPASSSGAAFGADGGAGSGVNSGADKSADCSADSGANRSAGDGARRGRASSGARSGALRSRAHSLQRVEHALDYSRRDHLRELSADSRADSRVDSDVDSDADSGTGGCCSDSSADNSGADCGADGSDVDSSAGRCGRRGRAQPCNSSNASISLCSGSCSSSSGSSSSSSSSACSNSSREVAFLSLVVCGDFPVIT